MRSAGSGRPGPSKPEGSTAAAAFAEALSLIANHRPTGERAADGPDRHDRPTRPAERTAPVVADGPIALAQRRLAERDLSAMELVEQAILAAEKQGAALGAVVELMADQARSDADRLDRLASSSRSDQPLGPLHGIPITVKDVIHVAGVATRAGSDGYHVVARRDGTAIARLRAAGAVIVAKVSTHEFALGVTTPQSANPFDHRRIPGGSSGGSAIAVACGIGLASVGTDTRASIRVPAALCGVVGLKGTHGLVPTDGIVPLSWSMDHVASMAATAADAGLVLQVMAGQPIGREERTDWVIGVPAAGFEGCEPAIATSVSAAIDRLGARAIDLERPDRVDFDLANAAGLIVSRCEAAAFHRSLAGDRTTYWQEVGDQLDAADRVRATDYLDAQRIRARLAADLLAVFEHCDVICLPTVGIQPPLREDFARFLTILSRPCVPWSLIGFPALSVPCGTDPAGLPVGLQIVGPPGADARILAVATAVEQGSVSKSTQSF